MKNLQNNRMPVAYFSLQATTYTWEISPALRRLQIRQMKEGSLLAQGRKSHCQHCSVPPTPPHAPSFPPQPRVFRFSKKAFCNMTPAELVFKFELNLILNLNLNLLLLNKRALAFEAGGGGYLYWGGGGSVLGAIRFF